MVRKTREAALETRNALLDTAELVFSEKGVSATTLADIASAAGVTRAIGRPSFGLWKRGRVASAAERPRRLRHTCRS